MSIASRRPLIGIPAGSLNSSHPGVKTFRFNGNYTAALAEAGALPVALPLNLPPDLLRELFERLDGLCLAGGGDVDPAQYGEEPHPAQGEIDPLRDEAELRLARWALAADLPVLGICRGVQVLNVAAGGTLYQDIPAQYPGALRHSYELAQSPWERPTHSVRLAHGSHLAHLLDASDLRTNSFHHQAVKDLAEGFRPVGWAEDGLIEAIESYRHRFALGVQWHPEAMTRHDPRAARLFQAFVEAAQQAQARPAPETEDAG